MKQNKTYAPRMARTSPRPCPTKISNPSPPTTSLAVAAYHSKREDAAHNDHPQVVAADGLDNDAGAQHRRRGGVGQRPRHRAGRHGGSDGEARAVEVGGEEEERRCSAQGWRG